MTGFLPPMHNDRQTRGGGVDVYVKESMYCKHRPDLQLPGLEAVWVQINCGNKNYLIGTFYRINNSSHFGI